MPPVRLCACARMFMCDCVSLYVPACVRALVRKQVKAKFTPCKADCARTATSGPSCCRAGSVSCWPCKLSMGMGPSQAALFATFHSRLVGRRPGQGMPHASLHTPSCGTMSGSGCCSEWRSSPCKAWSFGRNLRRFVTCPMNLCPLLGV